MMANLNLIESYDEQIATLETHLKKSAKVDDPIGCDPSGVPITRRYWLPVYVSCCSLAR
jgi:hypothetical protein